jgi:hypothetical protein
MKIYENSTEIVHGNMNVYISIPFFWQFYEISEQRIAQWTVVTPRTTQWIVRWYQSEILMFFGSPKKKTHHDWLTATLD